MTTNDPTHNANADNTTHTPAETPQPTHVDRTDLVEKARTFLLSPQVRLEDNTAKRKFLVEKGLTEQEIIGLLQESVS